MVTGDQKHIPSGEWYAQNETECKSEICSHKCHHKSEKMYAIMVASLRYRQNIVTGKGTK